MAAIGTGWVDGAWVEAGWVSGAWAQAQDVTLDFADITLTAFDLVVTGETGVEEQPTGGYAARSYYYGYRQRKRDEERRRLEALAALAELDPVTREIGELLHDPVAADEAEVEILRKLVVEQEGLRDELIEEGLMSEKVLKAYIRARKQQNYSAIKALEREVERAIEEQEFLLIAMALL